MKNLKSLFVYGFLIWLIPFVVSFFIFSLHENNRIFFETLMPLILITTVIGILIRYTKNNQFETTKEAALVGLIWMGINLFLDLFIFIWGPFKMQPGDYIEDIGLIYLLIPIITIGISKITYPKNRNPSQP